MVYWLGCASGLIPKVSLPVDILEQDAYTPKLLLLNNVTAFTWDQGEQNKILNTSHK